jgi:hypothetical protein
VRQNWSFGSGAHNTLQNKEGLARPTRLERVTLAFGGQRSSSRNMAWANDWPFKRAHRT